MPRDGASMVTGNGDCARMRQRDGGAGRGTSEVDWKGGTRTSSRKWWWDDQKGSVYRMYRKVT